ncbi:Anti-sigma regulatory factor (Ser/Thr protein kinase) [Streptomyces misionensis]|uniref:Anti-sigma regulatory factor (Ser/Thr protein kinase) n=1 Tax=Streptomyces misionensis TaxID=67331 RepID=A0A1H5E4W2_9ACTN|nr:Anti-sigma regulatory factor (Ser/Thr protein kinase) [Streptomyces misionensis]
MPAAGDGTAGRPARSLRETPGRSPRQPVGLLPEAEGGRRGRFAGAVEGGSGQLAEAWGDGSVRPADMDGARDGLATGTGSAVGGARAESGGGADAVRGRRGSLPDDAREGSGRVTGALAEVPGPGGGPVAEGYGRGAEPLVEEAAPGGAADAPGGRAGVPAAAVSDTAVPATGSAGHRPRAARQRRGPAVDTAWKNGGATADATRERAAATADARDGGHGTGAGSGRESGHRAGAGAGREDGRRTGEGAGRGRAGARHGLRAEAGPQYPQRLWRRLGRADLRAVPEARRELRELLRDWGKPGQSEIAELLTSELVTNALVHTDDDAVLTAVVAPGGLRVEVRDFVPRRPQVRTPQPDDDTHGRGMVLVESLADAWGVRPHGVGKSVWFELGAEAA